MTDRKGDGSYEGSEKFQQEQHAFARSGRVDDKAREAADALDSAEKDELETARKAAAQGHSATSGAGNSAGKPAESVGADAAVGKAPDPRRHYNSPEDLREDINLDLAEREELLRQWKQDIDRRLEAEAEGMSAQDPMSQDKESRLASEQRRVSALLADIVDEREKAGNVGAPTG